MRRTHRAVALAAMALWNPNAPPGSNFPNQRPVNDRYVAALRDAGVAFWAKRGVQLPPTTRVDVADDLDDPQGVTMARGFSAKQDPQGRVVLDGRNLGVELRRAHSKRLSTGERRAAIARLGQMIFHEMGHVADKDHTPRGLMSPGLGAGDIPWDARLLSHRLIPKPRR